MFCRYCGGKIDSDSRFCIHCGQNLVNDSDLSESKCHLTSSLSKHGDSFCLRVSKKILLFMSLYQIGIIAFTIVGLLVAIPAIFRVFNITGEISLVLVEIFMLAVLVFFLFIIIPSFRQVIALWKLPVKDNRFYFKKKDIKELRVCNPWFATYNFTVAAKQQNRVVDLPLRVKPAHSRDEAKKDP